MSDFRIVCVLGMHRSGTSVLARAMSALGVQLGDDLLGPKDDNPKGFFEDQDVLQLNEELLAGIGRNWYSVGISDANVLSPSRHQDLFERAVQLLSDRMSRFGLWGFKDPRTAILLPFWRKVFNTLELPVLYLISIRNPLSVARSLAARDDFPHAWSQILWLQHCCASLRNTAGQPRLVVDYDLLMSDPKAQLGRIAGVIGKSLDECSREQIDDFCIEFLDNDLRHTRFTAQDVRDCRPSLPCLADVFDLVSGLARDELSDDGVEARLLGGVDDFFQSAEAMLDLLDDVKGRADRRQSLHQETLAKALEEALALRAALEREVARRSEMVEMIVAGSKARCRSWLRDLMSLSPWRTWDRIRCARAIVKDGSLDVDYYLERYLDVAMSGMHPIAHFILHGAREGRDPNPHFRTSYYMELNKEVADSGINPLFHYIRHGRQEGRLPCPEWTSPQ